MMQLDADDRAMLDGEHGPAPKLAMRLLIELGKRFGAERFVDIEWAHVASAYRHGRANVDFARRLQKLGAQVRVPTTLTSCGANTLNSADVGPADRELIDIHTRMGCEPVLTCAPYQTRVDPSFGSHLAWCESSAVVYANSVLGARTNRYVEFADVCAAITGRVPYCGLHRDEHRRATALFDLGALPAGGYADECLFHVLGIFVGQTAGNEIPVLVGLPGKTTREQLRAFGAAAASSGSLGMFHAVGLTPEAPTSADALGHLPPRVRYEVSAEDIRKTAAMLSTGSTLPVTAVCIGAPHFSVDEFERLVRLFDGRYVSPTVRFIASTSTNVILELWRNGLFEALSAAGVEFVTGRCTYYRPAVVEPGGHVMTNSAKWAWYAPNDLEVDVTFASLAECVERACADG